MINPRVGRQDDGFEYDEQRLLRAVLTCFEKLGFQMTSFTLTRLKKQVSEDVTRETRKE